MVTDAGIETWISLPAQDADAGKEPTQDDFISNYIGERELCDRRFEQDRPGHCGSRGCDKTHTDSIRSTNRQGNVDLFLALQSEINTQLRNAPPLVQCLREPNGRHATASHFWVWGTCMRASTDLSNSPVEVTYYRNANRRRCPLFGRPP